ncbi:MAG: single-stranded-DNA-specific exonuclease, partial [Acetobacteraceae bacterium]|nr:single-stranded-DNA-specific exonuclease [Acetobacteraceae bacterium]
MGQPDGPVRRIVSTSVLTTDVVLGVTSSLSGRRWLWRTGEERVAAGIAQRLDLPEIVSRLLAARGIGIDAAVTFLE